MKPPSRNRPGFRQGSGSRDGPGEGPRDGPKGPPRDRAHGPRPSYPKPQAERPQRTQPQPAAAQQLDRERLRLAATPATVPPPPRPRTDRTQNDQRREERGRAAADTPRGAVWLYGTHAVAAALANPGRRLRRLLLTEDAEAAVADELRAPWPVAPERAERARLDQLLGRDIVHQGAALLADPLAPPPLAQALERPGPVLVLDQVTDPRNIGAILRSAAAFGVAFIIVQERNAPEESGALAKAASGALERVPLLRAVNIARTLIALKAAGCWTVGLAADAPNLSGPSLAQRRTALVLGSEGEGMRRLTRGTCDEVAGIAMPGGAAAGIDSLNVSAAAAVALYELGRR